MGTENSYGEYQESSPFTWLSDEIFIKGIFPNLPKKDLCKLTMVDRRLSGLAKDSCLWKDCTSPKHFKERSIKLSSHFKESWLNGFRAPVSDMTWYKKLLVTASEKTILVWDTHAHKTTYEFNGHKNDVLCVDVCGDCIVSGSRDNTVRIWKPEQKKHVALLKPSKKFPVTALQVHGKKAYMAAQGGIQEWDLERRKRVSLFRDESELISQLEIKGNCLAQLSEKTIVIWDARNSKKPQLGFCDIDFYAPNNATSIRLEGDQLYCGLQRGNLGMWDFRKTSEPINKDPLPRKNDPSGPTGSLTALKVGKMFIYAIESRRRRLSLWDKQTGEPIKYLAPWYLENTTEPKEVNSNYCLAIDEEGDGRVFVAAKNGGVMIRDYSGREPKKLKPNLGP